MHRCGSNKSPATRKEVASTNERRKINTKRGEEKKQNPPKTVLQKFNFRLKYLTKKNPSIFSGI